MHFIKERVISKLSLILPVLFLHTTPQMLKKRSINAEEAGIPNNCMTIVNKSGKSDLLSSQKLTVRFSLNSKYFLTI